MRLIRWFLLVLLGSFAACGCASTHPRPSDGPVGIERMMASTVKIEISVATSLVLNAGLEVPYKTVEVSGSGVIYGIKDGKSLVLSANHVLDSFKVGETEEAPGGVIRVDAVIITAIGYDGTSCGLEPLQLGSNDIHDVGTAIAGCELGPPAELASDMPPVGSEVFVTGHPAGFPRVIVTHGWVAGYKDGYFTASTPIIGGSSGGPMWYNGQVIGLAVRGLSNFQSVAIAVPVRELRIRINQTH